jgi:hypothetical protein
MPLKDPLKAFPFSPFSPLFSSLIKHTRDPGKVLVRHAK